MEKKHVRLSLQGVIFNCNLIFFVFVLLSFVFNLQILSDEIIRNGLSTLRWLHSQHRSEVVNLLEEEKTQIKSLFDEASKKIKQLHIGRMRNFEALKGDSMCDDIECRDVHITNDVSPSVVAKVCFYCSCQTGITFSCCYYHSLSLILFIAYFICHSFLEVAEHKMYTCRCSCPFHIKMDLN